MSASVVIERPLTHEEQVEASAHARRVQLANQTTTILAVTAVVFILVFGIIWLFSQQFIQLLVFDGLMSGMLGGSLLYKYLKSQQRERAGFVVFEAGFFLTVFGAAFGIPNLLPTTGLAYLVVILYAFLLLGDQGGRWILAGGILGVSVDIIFAESVAEVLFQPLNPQVERIVVLFGTGFALLVGGLLVRSVVLNQDNHFLRAQRANLEIEERVQAEQEQRARLEQANQEIETRAVREQEQREQLQRLIAQVQSLISNLNAASAEIQAATTQQMASAAEQDSAVTQTVATVEEVRTTVQQTAERAQAVADAAQQSVNVSRQGEDAVNDTVEGMAQIRERVENIAETILALSGRTQQIGEIIETVNALADQSKLLALNASIEAARAGEEGRGFAVVAMEVRQLAEQSRQSTARINDILNEIQQATNTAVMVTEEGSKGAERGMTLVTRAGEAIRDLAATLAEVTQAAVQIAASTHQQTNGMDQLAAAMQQIKQASTQASASSRQTEQSMRDLNHMTRQLEEAATNYNGHS